MIKKSNLTPEEKELIDIYIEIGAFKLGEFKLKMHEDYPDAQPSPVYCDLRVVQRHKRALDITVTNYCNLLSTLEYDLTACIPVAASLFAGPIVQKTGIGNLTPRVEKKTHGSGASIDGFMETDVGKKVVLVDDVVTLAGVKIKAAKMCQDAGLTTADVVVAIDREQGGREQLAAAGLVLHAILRLSQILLYLLEVGYIDEEVYCNIVYVLHQLALWPKTHPKPAPPVIAETLPPQDEETDVAG